MEAATPHADEKAVPKPEPPIHTEDFKVTAHGDVLAEEALGASVQPGYFRSPTFLGTVLAQGLSVQAAYFGWVLASNSLATMNEELGPSDSYLWIPLAYTLTLATGYLLFGRLSDIFGRRWFVIYSNALVLVGSIVACTAQSISALIVSNVFIGLGGAAQFSYGCILPELVPCKARGLVNGFIMVFSIPGAAFGPVIAKALIVNTAAGWRWNYYLTIIMQGIAILLFFLFYRPPTFQMLHMNRTLKEKVMTLDFGGITLFLAGMVLFLLGINWGGNIYPWKSAAVISTIIIGFLLLVAFVVYESYVPSDPFVPLWLLKNTQFMLLTVIACVGGMLYYPLNIVWPTATAALWTDDLIYQGWLTMAFVGGNTLGDIVCCAIFARIGRIRYQLMFFTTVVTALIGSLASTTQHSKDRSTVLVILGTIACGCVEMIPITSITFTVQPEDIGMAIGTQGAIRSAVGSIAVAMYGSVLSSRNTALSTKLIPKAVTAAGLPDSSLPALFTALTQGADALQTVPGFNARVGAALSTAQKDAFSGALKIVFLMTIAFGVCGMVASVFIKNIDHLLTGEVVRRLHDRGQTELHEAKAREYDAPRLATDVEEKTG
ncbi:hypothetical protein AYO21_06788 [Fonsecaea monophora]|uniref:Major facilitator superfamily (MFS) profile domain-containing protein n=1 Tax=Fonsecaea monophora TaxID=254056 RepID=A0A177F4B4_9EURO|nr:hypothetical protein AYO21_06788 [Fonsecaea monophora]OAG39068.1 hypothetical protein AYO21_06788 [Fonsecaea monophora]